MSDKLFVGLGVTSVEDNGTLPPISRVTLMVDDNNAITAGDDTGREIVADCPFATQEMVNALLANLQGYQYHAYTASDAGIDPAVELGDAVTVGGIYSVVSRIEDDGTGYPSIAAPGEAELEDEYPSVGPVTQTFNRQLAETRSLISKTSEEILLKVENELEGLSSSFSVQLQQITAELTDEINGLSASVDLKFDGLEASFEDKLNGLSSSINLQIDSITSTVQGQGGQISQIQQTVTGISSQVSGLDGQVSSITQKVDNITLDVTNGSTSSSISLSVGGVTVSSQTIQMNGLVTFTGLANGTTTIDGACIKTGTIEASRIDTDSLYVNAANITGSLTIGQLPNNVATTGDIPDRVSELLNDEGYQTERGVVEIIDGTVTADYVNALRITARTLQGREVELLDSGGSKVGAMEIVNTNSGDGLTIGTNRGGIRIETGQSGNIYISSGHGPFLMLGYGDTGSTAMCQLGGGPLVIPGASYGNRAPSGSGEYGEVYFQLE